MHGRPEIERVDLRGMLLDSIDPASLHWGRKLLRVEPAADETYDLHFANGVIETGFDLVIGADGAWSRVRPLLSNTRPMYSGIAGIDVTLSDVDNRHPDIAKRVGGGMCLTLGENRGILAQRNGGNCIRVYAFMRVAENWLNDCGIDWTQPSSAKAEMMERYFGDWEQGAKDSIIKSDPEVIPRGMYMLPMGFKWASKPGYEFPPFFFALKT